MIDLIDISIGQAAAMGLDTSQEWQAKTVNQKCDSCPQVHKYELVHKDHIHFGGNMLLNNKFIDVVEAEE